MSAILARQYEPQQMQPALPPQVQPAKALTTSSSRFWPTSGYEGWEYSVDWLLKGFIPSKSFGVVYGQSGSFKSFQVLDWACSIASGIGWMGCKVKSGLVYYIAAEGAGAFRKRVKGWCDVHVEGEEIPNLQTIGSAVDLTDNSQVSEVIEVILAKAELLGIPVRMVVIDTLARCFGGNDENNASDMGAAIVSCDRIKEATGATVVVVHHSGKDESKGARGSSALRAACDFEYCIKRNDGGNSYTVACTKSKDAEEPDSVVIDLNVVDLGNKDDEGDPMTTLARPMHMNCVYEAKTKTKTDVWQSEIIATLRHNDGTMQWLALRDEVHHKRGTSHKDAASKMALSRAMQSLIRKNDIQGSMRDDGTIILN